MCMDRMWQWAYDRYGTRYSWACWAISFPLVLPAYLGWAMAVVAFERSDRYLEAGALTVGAVLVYLYLLILPGSALVRRAERWAAGDDVDRDTALHDTYRYGRTVLVRSVVLTVGWATALFVGVGTIAGASGPRLAQYAVLGAVAATAGQLVTVHSYAEGALRPARVALTSGVDIGDSLPRARPTFVTWTIVAMLAAGFAFAVLGALLATVFDVGRHGPMLAVAIGGALVLAIGPTLWASYSPLLQPVRDLAAGTERVAGGDYGQRLPVVQDDLPRCVGGVVQSNAGGFG